MNNYLKVTEAAKLLEFDPSTVRRWIREGRIKSFKSPGGQHRISIEEFNRFRDEIYKEDQ
jgi:putative resolvase